MNRVPTPFTLSDIRRAIKAAQDMGLDVTGYTIELDKISVTTATADRPAVVANPLIQRLRAVR
jgi:hypothetical protein